MATLLQNLRLLSLRRSMRAIARARIGTRMEPIMRVIHRTHESAVVSDVLQLSLAFLELSVCRNIRNEIFHRCLLSFAIAITVIYFLVAPVFCSKLPWGEELRQLCFSVNSID